MLLGSESVKAVHRTLMKLSPGAAFLPLQNILMILLFTFLGRSLKNIQKKKTFSLSQFM
jgi:hypothetical protein